MNVYARLESAVLTYNSLYLHQIVILQSSTDKFFLNHLTATYSPSQLHIASRAYLKSYCQSFHRAISFDRELLAATLPSILPSNYPKMIRNFFDFNKNPKSWAARVIASEAKGVPIPTSHPPCPVIDRLYISNMLTASLFLKNIAPACYNATARITHVLSIVSDRAWHLEVIRKTKESSIIQKKIFIKDLPDANLLEYFPGKMSLHHPMSAIALLTSKQRFAASYTAHWLCQILES